MQRAPISSSERTTHTRGVLLLGMVLAASTLAGCSQPSAPNSQRSGIVSLNPCTDAILAQVADAPQIRALSAYSRDPNSSSMDVAFAKHFPATTGTVEEIVALQPKLVVSGNFTPPSTREALARLNIRLVEFPIASSVSESVAQVRQIAALAGHPERGETLALQVSKALNAARTIDGRPVQSLVWQSGGIVPGDQTLIADLLRRTGFANAAAARGLKQADFLPLERLLADPPALILAAGGKTGEDRMLAHPALAHLKTTHRAHFESRLLWCGGATIIQAARRLAEVRGDIGGAPLQGKAQ